MQPRFATQPLTPRHILIAGLTLLITVLAVWHYSATGLPGATPFSGEWRYRWDQQEAWQPWRPASPPERGQHTDMLLETTVPAGGTAGRALFIPPYTAFQSFEVRLADQVLYRSGALPAGFADRHRYHLWHLIDLPADATGKKLTFHFSSRHPRTIGLLGPVWLGNPYDLLRHFVLSNLPLAILAAILLVIGAASLASTRFSGAASRPQLAAFALTSLGAGCYLFSESDISQLLCNQPVFVSYLHYLSFFLFIIGICRYFQPLTSGTQRTIITLLCRLFSIYPLLATLLDLTGLVSWDITFSLALLLVMAAVCWFGLVICSSRFTATAPHDAPLVRAAFIPLFVAGLFDATVGLHLTASGPLLYPWGILVLMGVLFYRILINDREERVTALLLLEKARRDEESAITEERRRIARDMHDGIAQDLAMLQMRASVWEHLVQADREHMVTEITLFRKLLGKIIDEVRRVLFALRPVELEECGFSEAVRLLVETCNQNSNVRFSLELPQADAIPPALETELYRIIQETLNNIIKHAEADEASIAIQTGKDGQVLVIVRDNGKGFRPAQDARSHRLGLRQMQERVERRHGAFTLESSPGCGTVITILLPTTAPPAPPAHTHPTPL